MDKDNKSKYSNGFIDINEISKEILKQKKEKEALIEDFIDSQNQYKINDMEEKLENIKEEIKDIRKEIKDFKDNENEEKAKNISNENNEKEKENLNIKRKLEKIKETEIKNEEIYKKLESKLNNNEETENIANKNTKKERDINETINLLMEENIKKKGRYDDIEELRVEDEDFINKEKKKDKILNWIIVIMLFIGTIFMIYANFYKDRTVTIDVEKATEIALNSIPTEPVKEEKTIENPPSPLKNNPPIAQFIIKNPKVVVGEIVEFEDKSYDPDLGDKIINYHWENKRNIYTKPGTYPVTLKVQDSHGQWSAPVTHVVEVVAKAQDIPNIKPVCTFKISSPVYVGEQVIYEDNSYDPDGGEIVDRIWRGKRNYFDKPGTYTVTLQVRDDEMEWSDIASQTIIVKERPYIHTDTKPTAMFKLSKKTIIINEEVEFIDMSYDIDGDKIVEWDWSGNKQDKYTQPGEYLISLRVKDEHGNWSEKYTEKLTVVLPNNDRPVAEFRTNSPVVVGQKVEYYDFSYDTDGTIVERIWGGDKRYSYDKPGEYEVTLTVIDNKGKKDTIKHKIIVLEKPNIPPVAYFTTNSPVKAGERVYYYNQSYDEDGEIARIEWEGRQDYFDEPGEYPVKLTVYDELGESHSIIQHIVVEENTNQAPTAIISGPTEVYVNETAIFVDRSTDSDGYIVSNSWGSDKITKTWDTPGVKYVTLQVTDNGGRIAETTIAVLVKEKN